MTHKRICFSNTSTVACRSTRVKAATKPTVSCLLSLHGTRPPLREQALEPSSAPWPSERTFSKSSVEPTHHPPPIQPLPPPSLSRHSQSAVGSLCGMLRYCDMPRCLVVRGAACWWRQINQSSSCIHPHSRLSTLCCKAFTAARSSNFDFGVVLSSVPANTANHIQCGQHYVATDCIIAAIPKDW
jgi:hypothetical protein